MMPKLVDIVVVGGGVVGTALAGALARRQGLAGMTVALIDAAKAPSASAASSGRRVYDNRVFSLTPHSVAFLASQTGWDAATHPCAHAFRRMEVWDALSSGRAGFDAADMQQPHIGHFVEHAVLHQGVFASTSMLPNVDVRSEDTVVALAHEGTPPPHMPHEPLMHVKLRSGNDLLARLVVGADGAQSNVRKLMNLETVGCDYNQNGVVATLQLDLAKGSTNDTAFQRFLPTGPVALLPIDDQHCSLVWSTTQANAKLLRAMSPDEFVRAVNVALQGSMFELDELLAYASGEATYVPAFGWATMDRWKQIARPVVPPPRVVSVLDGSRALFPLSLRHAPQYACPRVALVGDAAHVIHPLAGQGLNLGLSDAEELVSCLSEARLAGQDVGDVLVLEEYSRRRQLSNVTMLAAVHGLHRVFSAQWEPMIMLRALGLNATSLAGPLKSMIMKYAMGGGALV